MEKNPFKNQNQEFDFDYCSKDELNYLLYLLLRDIYFDFENIKERLNYAKEIANKSGNTILYTRLLDGDISSVRSFYKESFENFEDKKFINIPYNQLPIHLKYCINNHLKNKNSIIKVTNPDDFSLKDKIVIKSKTTASTEETLSLEELRKKYAI